MPDVSTQSRPDYMGVTRIKPARNDGTAVTATAAGGSSCGGGGLGSGGRRGGDRRLLAITWAVDAFPPVLWAVWTPLSGLPRHPACATVRTSSPPCTRPPRCRTASSQNPSSQTPPTPSLPQEPHNAPKSARHPRQVSWEQQARQSSARDRLNDPLGHDRDSVISAVERSSSDMGVPRRVPQSKTSTFLIFACEIASLLALSASFFVRQYFGGSISPAPEMSHRVTL